jgi:hypothetical protein
VVKMLNYLSHFKGAFQTPIRALLSGEAARLLAGQSARRSNVPRQRARVAAGIMKPSLSRSAARVC